MKIPYLSGLRVSGNVELKNLQEQIGATKYLTIDVNNNVTWSSGSSGGGGNVDLSNYFTKSQSDAKYQLKGNYLTSVQWSDITGRPTSLSQFTNDSAYVTASIINGLAKSVDVYTKVASDGRFQPLENQRLSSINEVSFSKVKAVNELVIPSSTSNVNGSIWIGNANSTGHTSPTVTTLSSLQDVAFTNLQNGQSIAFDSATGKWINRSYLTSVSWTDITNKPTLLSQFTNNLGFVVGDGASVVGFVADNKEQPYFRHITSNEVIGIARTSGINIDINAYRTRLGLGSNAYESKTNLSQFTNDLKYITAEYNSGGSELPNYFGSNKLKLNMLWDIDAGGWLDTLWMSSYGGGDVKNSNLLFFGKTDANVIGYRTQDYDSNTWGTKKFLYHTGNNDLLKSQIGGSGTGGFAFADWISTVGFASNDVNQPYFRRTSDGSLVFLVNRDSLGASAYVSETLQSVRNKNNNLHQTDNSSTSYSVAAIQLRESNEGGSTAFLAPRLAFHWGGVVASQISIEASGRIAIINNAGNGYENFIANDITASNRIDSPIARHIAKLIIPTSAPAAPENGCIWIS